MGKRLPYFAAKKTTNTQSVFRLEFELNESEIDQFKSEIKSYLNGTLPIEIKIGRDHEPKITVIKKGKGAKTLNAKSKIIADYISKRIFFNYIPAVRTDHEAISVVNEMLSEELAKLEENKAYQNALETINKLQTPVLKKLSLTIKESLLEFIPHIKEVSIEIQESRRRSALRQQFDISIDDGNKTSLEYKGDGVKSLAALGLLKNIQVKKGVVSLIAIEEPESHLHPGAIHILRDTIFDLASESQVLVSTHNPLFVNRNNIKGNILIDSGTARSAKSIKEIRELIGIKASDNLLNASYVLIVEGEEDVIALRALLPFLSENLSKALKNHILIIDKIGGAGNLSYKVSMLKNSLCSIHILLDNDEAGRKAYDNAFKDDGVKLKDCTFINCNGMTNAEFEDCLNSDIYAQLILDNFGVDINVSAFRGNEKWSNRMRTVFLQQGKRWDDRIEIDVKTIVANSIINNEKNALSPHKRNSIDALVQALERLIENTK